MTNYTDLPSVSLVHHKTNQYIFNREIPDEITEYLIQLIKQRGFSDYDPECIVLLQSCLIDFYNDLLIRFKQHLESLGSSITFQDAFQRTLDDVMSSTLKDLQDYMNICE